MKAERRFINQRILKRLYDALDCAGEVGGFIAGRTLDEYFQDRYLRSAVEREPEKTGEALVSVRNLEPGLLDQIPGLNLVIGLRYQIVHQYDELDDARIWSIAEDEAPKPVLALKQLLNEIGDIEV